MPSCQQDLNRLLRRLVVSGRAGGREQGSDITSVRDDFDRVMLPMPALYVLGRWWRLCGRPERHLVASVLEGVSSPCQSLVNPMLEDLIADIASSRIFPSPTGSVVETATLLCLWRAFMSQRMGLEHRLRGHDNVGG